MKELFGQIIGIIAMIIGALQFQVKNNKKFLICQIVVCGLFSLSFLLTSAWTASMLNLLCVGRAVWYFFCKDKKDRRIATIFLTLGYIAVTVLSITVFNNEWFIALIVCAATVVSGLGIASNNEKLIRVLQIVFVSPCWIVNGLYYFNIGALISDGLNMVSSVIALIRWRIHRSDNNTKYLERLVSLKKTIGNTPLIKFIFKINGTTKEVYAKEEFLNPSGSIKIRPAYQILFDAIREGRLKQGQRVVEVTSGNMGISLAYLCKRIGNPITILMPKTMSKERRKILVKLGAEVRLTKDFIEAFEIAKKLGNQGNFLPDQFNNKSNLLAHEETAKEILNEVDDFEAFVSGVGTAGTLIGAGSYLKNKKNVKLVAVDPKESGLLINGKSLGKHKIQGLSDQIIPGIYDKNIIDDIIEIKSDDAIVMARKINQKFGIGIGISSGANLLGALLSKFNKIVTVIPDDDSKYRSTDLYNESISSTLLDTIELIDCEKLSK